MYAETGQVSIAGLRDTKTDESFINKETFNKLRIQNSDKLEKKQLK